jgi:hypothetical protein
VLSGGVREALKLDIPAAIPTGGPYPDPVRRADPPRR